MVWAINFKKKIHLEVNPFFLIILLIALIFGYIDKFLAAFMSIMLHELGHVVLTVISGGRVYIIRILPVGFNAVIEEGECSRLRRVYIYFGGPITNLIIVLLCLIMEPYYLIQTNNMHFFISINLWLAIFNLIPILPLDGGKVLREVLAERVGLFIASKYIRSLSIVLSSLAIILGIVQFLNNNHNFSLLLVGAYISFIIIFERRETALMNVKSVVYRRSRILKKGVYPARNIVVVKSMHMGEVLKSMDFDMFHIIHVLDENLGLVKVLTEQEMIDFMLKFSSDMTFDDLIKGGHSV
ncbi:MAG: site-2 protease family protein [Clostridia bacterium]|nr:site-2 protease family protein [Clostridia bacterium]